MQHVFSWTKTQFINKMKRKLLQQAWAAHQLLSKQTLDKMVQHEANPVQ